MKFYSTRDKEKLFSLKEALMLGMAPDGGLFMPEQIPHINIEHLLKGNATIHECAYAVLSPFLLEDFDAQQISEMISAAFNFEVPIISLEKNLFLCELFHGPTLAFKDFGARMMAQLMSAFLKNDNDEITILVATSGDTGSAVASGFFNVPNIKVVILYPAGKVSTLQELQLTTYGGNITALKVEGTFDDCQALVKQAFADDELRNRARISSANSINIGRLLPQMIYYAYTSIKMKKDTGSDCIMCVPSGNFGNLTAALMVKQMGFPIKHFYAATNANDTVPDYFKTKNYTPKKSQPTISNAMDVGNPSNFERMLCLYDNNFEKISTDISAIAISDDSTISMMKEVFNERKYLTDPHTAVAIAATRILNEAKNNLAPVVVMATAHPAKFAGTIEQHLPLKVEIPDKLENLRTKLSMSTDIDIQYQQLVKYI